MLAMLLILLLASINGLTSGHLLPDFGRDSTSQEREYCPVFYTEPPRNCRPLPRSFIESRKEKFEPPLAGPEVLEDAYEAFEVLQEEFFDADFGTWPSAIDWTGAVIETVVSGMLTTLTKSLRDFDSDGGPGWKEKENLLSSYFAEVVNSYYGQDILSLRGEAFDDMLWVVLGWIEAVKFVREHASRHYLRDDALHRPESRLHRALQSKEWHGNKWVPFFAHRARMFWNLASRGWDTSLCNGGMVWDRRLSPYKNAITNELWISASISMYQYYPGDNITSPWTIDDKYRKKDPAHLAAAIEGYRWIMGVNMMNQQGLFVDGYHISRRRGNTQCDLRDEMVYTYNQGVLLTGHRGLWTITGSASYLEDGHNLIQSVIKATGWSLDEHGPVDASQVDANGGMPPWHGIGRYGILEERCDASGTCSQDGQAFKGIFFHHMTAFCAPLDPITVAPGVTLDVEGFERVKTAHLEACNHYLGWVRHNAIAAMSTRDSQGVFGMWWGAGMFGETLVSEANDGINHAASNTTDYRNQGTPRDDIWGQDFIFFPGDRDRTASGGASVSMGKEQVAFQPRHRASRPHSQLADDSTDPWRDPNERGRGRSVETQMGGLAVLRAYWELSQKDDSA
ncbi:hypothetical protein NLU13_1376 [Sarocladium strictum]|uniref:Glycosyl hydrolase n=1 Tax=Sarocladium strictum TaxID=5046 RepID=A0AA39LC63_SARSR|nr:hypothetical protein NLU13_1376 [Sarocladium strictum]